MTSRRPIRRGCRFGPFTVDLEARDLYRDGHRVPLQGLPFRLLEALLADAGAVVPRDALRRALWGDETFVDAEDGLRTAVAKLRDALADPASNPTYVETVPRVGYRFVAAVEPIAPPAHAVEPGATPSRAVVRLPRGARRAGLATRTAVAAMLTALAVASPGGVRPRVQPDIPAAARAAFQDGVYLLDQPGRQVEAIGAFTRALDAAPGFAAARAGRARAAAELALAGARPRAFIDARRDARGALARAPRSADALVALAAVHLYFEWDPDAAVASARAAVSAAPALAAARLMLAAALTAAGRTAEAVAEARRAVDVDPRAVVRADLGFYLLAAGRPRDALEECRRALALAPDSEAAWRVLALAARSADDAPAAREAAEALARVGTSPDPARYPVVAAARWAADGEAERALAALEQAVVRRDAFLVFLRADPSFAVLRDDARFKDLVRRVGLPAA